MRLSKVKILFRVVDHSKKTVLGGACVCHTLLGETPTFSTSQGVKEELDLEGASFGGNPPQSIFTPSSYFD
jgi:hypothetical protein